MNFEVNFDAKPPVFIPQKKEVQFFMPHFPIFTGNIKSDLVKVRCLLAKLGNPQFALKGILHIVGTNGKGSSTAYLKAILMEEGYKVNVFTSPHLYAVNERIHICGKDISDESLFFLTEKVRILCEEEKLELTIFESLTIVAMLAFAQSDADFNIFEAGMGGEHDATNVFEDVLGVLLTSISFDHTRFLGESLSEIAFQKLGVAKKDKPLVLHPFSKAVLEGIALRVVERKPSAFFYGRDYNFSKLEFEDGKFGIEVEFANESPIYLPMPSLAGEHQITNLACAVVLLKACDVKVSEKALILGALKAKWPARLERVLENKLLCLLPNGSEIWFDGAHNPGGAAALASWIKDQDSELKNVLIVSKTRGSEVVNFISAFSGIIDFGIAIEGKGEIYPEFASVLLEGFFQNAIKACEASDLQKAIEIAGHAGERARVVITGSLYLAREVSRFC